MNSNHHNIINEIEGHELTGEDDPGRIIDYLLKRYPDMALM